MNETIIDFYRLLNIDIDKKHYYHFWTLPNSGGRQLFVQSNSYLSKMLESGKKKNCFFFVNNGEMSTVEKEIKLKNGKTFSYTKEIEERNSNNIKDYNAFYYDFDIIQNGQHINGANLKNVKSGLMYKLMQLPVEPSAIIESRNGFHLYYAINEQDRHIDKYAWKHIEIGIYNYIKSNVSEYVDNNCLDGARILRCAGSVHAKADNDTDFPVQVAYISYRRYTVEEIKTAYNIADAIEKPTRSKQTDNAGIQYNNDYTDIVRAIKALDYTFFSYIDKIDSMDTNKEVNYIKSINILDFLEINCSENEAFSSILREDNNPSCTVFCADNNVYLYHDFGTSQVLDLIHIVMAISGCNNKTAFIFLCKIFFRQEKNGVDNSTIDEFINNNKQVLIDLSESDKKYKFVKKLLVTYTTICEMLKERATMTNVPYLHYNLQCSRDYIAERSGVSNTNVTIHLMILEFIGVLKPVRAYKTMAGKKSVKTYQLNDLVDRADVIRNQADVLKDNCKNVFKVTKAQLEKLITF